MYLIAKLMIVTLVCVIYIFSPVDAGNCSTIPRDVPTFWNCEYRCHCKNDAQCDRSNGACEQGCKFGWMGPACQYRNMAGHYINTGQFFNNTIISGRAAVDGDIKTCTLANISDVTGEQYWYIQFNRTYNILGIMITIPKEDVENHGSFRIETSDHLNDTYFPTLCAIHNKGDRFSYYEEHLCHQRTPVQQLRIRLLDTDAGVPLRLCEVEIFGGMSIGFNKASSQKTTFSGWYSHRAVNGHTTAHCSATNHVKDPWWRLNLGTTYIIHEIQLYGDTHYAYYQGFTLSVGTNLTSLIELYTDTTGSNNDINVYQPMVIEIQPPTAAQYIQIQLTGKTTMLSICGIVVFAECPRNRCGHDCSQKCYCTSEVTGNHRDRAICPYGCQGRWTECALSEWGAQCEHTCGHCADSMPCNVTTGHCANGCSGPWVPPFCTESCPDYKYGINCGSDCGMCQDNKPCNITDGTCMFGCQPGWKPPTCHELYLDFKLRMECSLDCQKCKTDSFCNTTDNCNHTCQSDWRPTMMLTMFPDRINKSNRVLELEMYDGTDIGGDYRGYYSLTVVIGIVGSCGTIIVILSVIIGVLLYRQQRLDKRGRTTYVKSPLVETPSDQVGGRVQGGMMIGARVLERSNVDLSSRELSETDEHPTPS